MILRIFGSYLLVMFSFLFLTCSGSVSLSSKLLTKFPEGRDLYKSKCSACHKLYERELHSKAEWQKILDDMGSKARLTGGDKAIILSFLSEWN